MYFHDTTLVTTTNLFYPSPSLSMIESLHFHCLPDTNKKSISSKRAFWQGSCFAQWFMTETLAWEAEVHTYLLWELRRVIWWSIRLSPSNQVLLPGDVLNYWKQSHVTVCFVSNPVGDLCLSTRTAESELGYAQRAQRDKHIRQQNQVVGLSFLPNFLSARWCK